MRIAIPYENGNIFQHFGRSEAFKFYDVDGGAVTSTAVVSTNGSGHGALAGFLVANHADVAARTRQCRRCSTVHSVMIPRRAAIITTTRTARVTSAATTAATADNNSGIRKRLRNSGAVFLRGGMVREDVLILHENVQMLKSAFKNPQKMIYFFR